MTTRSAPAHAIELHDLRSCTDVASIFALFRKLRFPVEPHPVAVPLEAEELPGALRDQVAERYMIADVSGDRPGELPLSVTLFVLHESANQAAAIRGIAQAWTRRFAGEHLLVFVRQVSSGNEFGTITFVNSRRLGDGAQVRIKLHKLIVDRANPTRHDLDTLNAIALPVGQTATPAILYQLQCSAFDVERITNDFYREYARLFKEVMQRIKDENKSIAAFSDDTRLHTFTQRLFSRLMFLYFLQKKGALNGQGNFVTYWYIESRKEQQNFYRTVLEPLFFQTLNQPRPNSYSPTFGRVPYLNGGLFAPDDDDLEGEVYLADEIFDPKNDTGLLYFLDAHNFTIEEDTPLEVEVALDPEMLGKVFENLLEAEERGTSGTFYTPRPVVAFLCREALAAYLSRATGLEANRLGWLLDEAETGEPAQDDRGRDRLTSQTLPRHLRERIEQALKDVRVLDPAVGSGAFPLGMLALLVGVRRALYRVAEAIMAPHAALVEGWKRDCIRDCLYGVDIKREAVEIARLRLWLSLVVDANPFEMEPLPNLDYKLMDGDSLIETFDGVEIFPTRPNSDELEQGQLAFYDTGKLIDRLRDLHAAYFQPERPDQRDDLKRQIHEAQCALVEIYLKHRIEDNTLRLNEVLDQEAKLKGPEPRMLAIKRTHLEHDIAVTQQALADLRMGKTLPFFLFRLHFGSVFKEKDGFDIVIANPPYVRHERVPQETLRVLKAAYPDVQHGMADLYVYFYARGLQLLHEGGTLAYITSNKYFRAGYGQRLRDLLATGTQARVVIDFGDARVFDAAAYPCIVIADKGAPMPDHTYRGLTVTPAEIRDQADLDRLRQAVQESGQTMAQAAGVRPPASSATTEALVQKLMQMGTPLGEYAGGKIYYGIKTGLNEAFVVDQATRDRLIAEDPRSVEVLKPFLRGRDVGRYAINSAGKWLIRIENGWTQAAMQAQRPVPENEAWSFFAQTFPSIAAYLEPFADRARRRDDQGRYWWELRPCDYYAAFEGPKIIYPELAQNAEAVFDSSNSYIDCTIFCIPANKAFITAMINSSLIDFVLLQLSPAVSGNFRRYKKEYMRELPIIEPVSADQARLEELVNDLQAVGGQGPHAAELEREVDAIVYRTYGLDAGEIAEIERWHAERRATLGRGRRDGDK